MKGKAKFTRAEAALIRDALQRLRRAERNEQKSIQAGLRRRGFHISDWRSDGEAFTRADFDVLVRDGLIKIVNGEETAPYNKDSSARRPRPQDPVAQQRQANEAAVPSAIVAQAIAVLSDRGSSVIGAENTLPDAPGLYAIHGDPKVWEELGLGEPPDFRPLYVGKAEDSLVRRDLRTHFKSGKTGSSTLRRSLAGLLAERLDLHARPRNLETPARFANYGLEEGQTPASPTG